MKISVSEFKARCTQILREVAEKPYTVEITKRGKVVAVVKPAGREAPRKPREFFGSLKGTASHVGDIVSPAVDASEWDAMK